MSSSKNPKLDDLVGVPYAELLRVNAYVQDLNDDLISALALIKSYQKQILESNLPNPYSVVADYLNKKYIDVENKKPFFKVYDGVEGPLPTDNDLSIDDA